MSGAEFRLYRLNCSDPSNHDHSGDLVTAEGGCWTLVGTQTSGENGSVSFGALVTSSEYRLVETKAPDGYALPEGQWRITTDANNNISITAIGAADGQLPTAFATGDSGTLLLPNARPLDIPSSGGWGTWPFLLGGGLLMLLATGLLLIKRRPKGKHEFKNSKG